MDSASSARGGRPKAPESQAEPFESKLLEVVPGDAVAFLTFKGGDAYAAAAA